MGILLKIIQGRKSEKLIPLRFLCACGSNVRADSFTAKTLRRKELSCVIIPVSMRTFFFCIALCIAFTRPAYAQKSILDEPGQVIFDGYIGDHYDIVMILKKTTGNKFEGRYIYKKQTAFI